MRAIAPRMRMQLMLLSPPMVRTKAPSTLSYRSNRAGGTCSEAFSNASIIPEESSRLLRADHSRVDGNKLEAGVGREVACPADCDAVQGCLGCSVGSHAALEADHGWW